MQSETLSLRITKSESDALRARARKEGISRALLVRKALRAYGLTPEPSTAQSGYDVIKGLIGKQRGGSTDLSTNPRHLDGYGR